MQRHAAFFAVCGKTALPKSAAAIFIPNLIKNADKILFFN